MPQEAGGAAGLAAGQAVCAAVGEAYTHCTPPRATMDETEDDAVGGAAPEPIAITVESTVVVDGPD